MTDAGHKLPLDAIVARRALPGIMDEAEKNWRGMYHNISLHDFPYEDDELKQWDWYIESAYGDMKEDITEYLQDNFNEHWTFYQTGRSGATFYPDEPAGGADYSINNCAPLMDIRHACFDWKAAGTDDYELLPVYDNDDEDMAEFWLYNYKQAKHYQDVFAWINETVKRHMEFLSDGWAEWKEANEDLFETDEEEAA